MMPGVLVGVLVGAFGKPPDMVAWAALGVAGLCLLLSVSPKGAHSAFGFGHGGPPDEDHDRRLMLVGAFAAAFLSLGYIAFYLRGGPRIIDASSYFLQARAIAHGKLAFSVPEPSASFRGRFLLFHEPDRLAVIFPPGYPLILALGFLVGAPMVVGPLLAAAIALATYMLTLELGRDASGARRGHGEARLAMVLSLVCAALRYHTADTMSHGASALGITLAFACALRGRRTDSISHFVLAGLAAGWVLSTRPVSAGPILLVVGLLASQARARTRAFAAATLAVIPGVLLLMAAQRVATGSALASVQRAYYATSDGPPECFRYGFGPNVGCLLEHGDVVRPRLPGGYTLRIAFFATLHRLKFHLIDIANFEPLALLVLVPPFVRKRLETAPRRLWASGTVLALALVGAQILAYAPFYFDGSYPGGGARFFADVLPVEHALMALAIAWVLPRVELLRKGLLIVGLACLGFSIHAAFDHEALANRDGGRPFYEPDVAREAQLTRGLVFFDTDHGWNLAHDPGTTVDKGIVAARMKGDDHDRMLWELLGKPPTHAYHFSPQGGTLNMWLPSPANEDTWRFEAEMEWPPLAQSGGYADPIWASGTCASAERALTLRVDSGSASTTVELPVPRDGRWLVTPRVMRRGGKGNGSIRLLPLRPDGATTTDDAKLVWEWTDAEQTSGRADPGDSCLDLPAREVSLLQSEGNRGGARLVLTATGGDATFDRTMLKWLRK